MRDFTGFSFGDWHSSDPETGIVIVYRVSGGDRYDEELHPEIKDRTAEVPGLNGEYYFGSDFGPRSFDIEIAFDSLSEEQFRKLRQVFGTKDIKKLIFDERPYKYYLAKLESPIELSYVCFDEPKKIIGVARDGVRAANRIPITEEVEGEEQIIGYTVEREQITPYEYQEGTQRVYKGEGKITFKAYFPFAKSVYKVLPNNEEGSDWAVSSGILSAAAYNNIIDTYNAGEIKVYNAGDLETGFRLYCPSISSELHITYTLNTETIAALVIEPFETKTGDNGFIIDTNTGLITGVVNSTMKIAHYNDITGEVEEVEENEAIHIDYYGNVFYTTSGNLYNRHIKNGSFFKLQPNILSDDAIITISGVGGTPQIFYDYLYF